MWERGWSFIKKAGTIILVSTIAVWFTTYFGVMDGKFQMLSEDQIDYSILATIGKAISGSSFHRDGATGRQPLHLLQVWLQKRTLLVHWVSFTEAETQAFTQPWEQLSQQ